MGYDRKSPGYDGKVQDSEFASIYDAALATARDNVKNNPFLNITSGSPAFDNPNTLEKLAMESIADHKKRHAEGNPLFSLERNPTPPVNTTLPTESKARKEYPIHTGCLRYFPAALAGVAKTSKLGNDKHNPGEELHHARGKSMDHGDCIIRHLIDLEDLLTASAPSEQILSEASSLAWRALALSQELHEKFGAPLAPGAK